MLKDFIVKRFMDPMPAQYRSTAETIRDNAELTRDYMVMNGLAAVIAGYGLLQGSAAVVIGAMLIAMLIGPINGIGLSLVCADMRLFTTSIRSEIAGAVLILGVGALLGFIHNDVPYSQELINRTSPNIMDLMIALAGGAAGAYALVSPRLSAAIAGIAIATALCPPLTTCGILLARGEMAMASGAFILFFTNLCAISLGAMIIFHIFGVRGRCEHSIASRLSISGLLAVSVLLGAYLTYALHVRMEKVLFQRRVELLVQDLLKPMDGVYLAQTSIVEEGNLKRVYLMLRTPELYKPKDVAALEQTLSSALREPLVLHVRSTLTVESTSSGYVGKSSGFSQSDE